MLRFEKFSEYKRYRKNLAKKNPPQNPICLAGMEKSILYDLFLIDMGDIGGLETEVFIAKSEDEAEAFRKKQENLYSDLISRNDRPCIACPYTREVWDTQGGRIIILYTKLGEKTP